LTSLWESSAAKNFLSIFINIVLAWESN